eukprot:Platyproteum_vivax@DN16173_c0_g1_i1.p2
MKTYDQASKRKDPYLKEQKEDVWVVENVNHHGRFHSMETIVVQNGSPILRKKKMCLDVLVVVEMVLGRSLSVKITKKWMVVQKLKQNQSLCLTLVVVVMYHPIEDVNEGSVMKLMMIKVFVHYEDSDHQEPSILTKTIW